MDFSCPQPGEYVTGPRMEDVASTRDRTWHTHAQNIFYSELIQKAGNSLTPGDGVGIKSAAERIVDIIMVDKRGVFVRKSPKGWVVMDRKQSIVKAQAAIRNWFVKMESGGWKNTIAARGKKKGGRQRNKPRVSVIYRAEKGGEKSIHPYALLLITAVCNHPHPQVALHVLDEPLSHCFAENEPPKERTIRLQLRHRFAGALANGLTPLSFAEKLLELWGGSLSKIDGSAIDQQPVAEPPHATEPKEPSRSDSLFGNENDKPVPADALMAVSAEIATDESSE